MVYHCRNGERPSQLSRRIIMKDSVAVWFIGLSGAGKSTISRLVAAKLRRIGLKVEVLDADEVRQQLSPELGFSKTDRMKNIERTVYVARLLIRNGVIVLAAFITPNQAMRDYCRREIGAFIEVYVKCPLAECIRRDVKGLYAKALKGEISTFTGISDIFEEPLGSEIVVETDKTSPALCAEQIVSFLHQHQFIPGESR